MPNFNAIFSELQRCVGSSAFKSDNKNAIASVSREQAEKALDLLVGCINDQISVSGSAMAAIGSASGSGVSQSGDVTQFVGTVDIPQNYRPSLRPDIYGGVDDMAKLFNDGYSAGGTVVGEWHGMMISSLQHREGLDFVNKGVDAFNSSYGGEYNAHAEVSGRFS